MGDTCPKCGMNLVSWAAVMQHIDSPFCIEQQLRIMTARAEKAEAEVVRLRNAVGLRDWLRYEYVEETMETLAKRCRWCGRMERDGCDPRICPTITHPAETAAHMAMKGGAK